MEYSTQGSLCKYSSPFESKRREYYIKIKEDQSRQLKNIDRHFTINFINIGPNVNLKIPARKINPTQQEKEFFKNKIKVTKKTELCKNWELYRSCYFKDQCSFAHGEAELRQKPVIENPRYKTKPCKAFFEKKYCAFGNRCQYNHSKPPAAFEENFANFTDQLYTVLLQNEHSDDFDLLRTLNAALNIKKFKRLENINLFFRLKVFKQLK
jgi:hypothetical protein